MGRGYLNMFQNPYNSDIVKDLKEINENIDSELKKDDIDKDALLKYRLMRMQRGMDLNSANYNRFNRFYPY